MGETDRKMDREEKERGRGGTAGKQSQYLLSWHHIFGLEPKWYLFISQTKVLRDGRVHTRTIFH